MFSRDTMLSFGCMTAGKIQSTFYLTDSTILTDLNVKKIHKARDAYKALKPDDKYYEFNVVVTSFPATKIFAKDPTCIFLYKIFVKSITDCGFTIYSHCSLSGYYGVNIRIPF